MNKSIIDNDLLENIIKKVLDQYYDNKILNKKNEIPVGISARHVHISQKDLDILFGKNYKLNLFKQLMADEFAAKEQITIVGPAFKVIEKVRILGPVRNKTQVEISKTDAFFLKLDCPIRDSGDLLNSSPIILIGPNGVVNLKEGCIIANRHIHMNAKDALKLNLKNNDVVNVLIDNIKKTMMYNVKIRISENARLEMHIDIDDANACGLKCGEIVKIFKNEG